MGKISSGMEEIKPRPRIELSSAVKAAADVLGFDKDILDKLYYPKHLYATDLKIKLDSGEELSVPAYRSQYSNVRGPYKGGIRFHEDVNVAETTLLSALMAFKTALVNIPMGGGKGGVKVDNKKLSNSEHERIAREYIRSFYEILGSKRDIPAPDLNTNPQTMAFMMDEYAHISGQTDPGVVTGKPVSLFGSEGRDNATSLWGKLTLDKLVKHLNLKKTPLTVAIQGIGNVGGGLAKLLDDDAKYKVVAISDSNGAIYNGKGLNIREAMEHKQKTKSVEYFEYAQTLTIAEMLELSVDVLALAAIEDQINDKNANNVKAQVVLELANNPITSRADEILDNKHITVIPDILANAGGVVVSYFEWVQNNVGFYWTRAEVSSRLENMLEETVNNVLQSATEHDVNLRIGSYVLALKRLKEALTLRGKLN